MYYMVQDMLFFWVSLQSTLLHAHLLSLSSTYTYIVCATILFFSLYAGKGESYSMLKTTIEPGLCLGCTCKWANKKTLPQTSSLINERDRHLCEFLPCSVIFMSLPLNYNSMIARKPWLLRLLSKPRPLRFI